MLTTSAKRCSNFTASRKGGSKPPFLFLLEAPAYSLYSSRSSLLPLRYDVSMAIAIRDDVANGPPYNRLIERLLSEGRTALVCRCSHHNCARSLFVFHESNTAAEALKWHVGFLLERSDPDHDPVYAINEDLPP
jgi:hypothetical protein